MSEADLYFLDSGDGLFKPVRAANPLPVDATVSASVSGFTPNGNVGTPLAASNVSSAGSLPSGAVVVFSNVGSVTAYLALGATATTGDLAIPANGQVGLTVGAATQFAAITASGTTTLNTAGGTGLFSSSGGGSGGGGGISGLTTNTLPKATSSTTIGDSRITEDANYDRISSPDTLSYVAVGNDTVVIAAGAGILSSGIELTSTTAFLFDSTGGQVAFSGGVLNLGSATGTVAAGWVNVAGGFAVNGTAVGGGSILTATVDISQSELTSLATTVKTVVAAPGAGQVLSFLSAFYQYLPSTSLFPLDGGVNIYWATGGVITNSAAYKSSAVFNLATYSAQNIPVLSDPLNAAIVNADLVFSTDVDFGVYGPVTSIAINAAGLGYAANDTFTIDTGTTLATGTVLTVGGGGAVASVQLNTGGQSYTTTTANATTATSGVGTGLTLDTTVPAPATGTARVTVTYQIVPELT